MAARSGMVAIDARPLDGSAAYRLISGIVTPRPIAWVSSLNASGAVNLAPFSSYIFLTYDPPKIGLSIGPGSTVLKDTLHNIEGRREFVVNSVSPDQLEAMVETSLGFPPGRSEAEALGIAMAPSLQVTTPRVRDSEVAMECVLDRVVPLEDRDAHRLVIGRVITFQVDAVVLGGDRIDPHAFRPVGRIGGRLYAMPGEIRLAAPTRDPAAERGGE
jgi:flavin reductase (DIM6/NTAB) family NADH-FMN oxidoreductase RutF